MRNRFSYVRELVPGRTTAPSSSDSDECEVGAWTSSSGIKVARWGREGAPGAAVRKTEVWDAVPGDESSFESLDLRAAEVLDRSMQALESSSSLTSCALAMMTDLPNCWEGGGGGGGGWEVEKAKLKTEQEVGWSRDWGQPDHLHPCRLNNEGTALTTFIQGCSEHDITRVLKEIINNNNMKGDNSSKLSSKAVEIPDGGLDKMAGKDLKVMKSKENSFEEEQLDHSRPKFWNEVSREKPVGGNSEVLPTPAFRNSTKQPNAENEGKTVSTAEKTREMSVGSAATLDAITQTKPTGFSGCSMLPPKGKGSLALRLPMRPKGEELPRKSNAVALHQKRRQRSVKGSHGSRDRTPSDRRKLIVQVEPPRWRGLSTALSAMRSICHGAGEVGVANAQVRPLLVIAGKCVFRTAAPLDTPRTCAGAKERSANGPSASLQEGGHSVRAVDVSREDEKKASAHSQPSSNASLSPVRNFEGPSRALPGQKTCQGPPSAIMRWPAAVTELDTWISQIINEWVDGDDNVGAVANSSPARPSPTTGGPISPPVAHSEEILCVRPISSIGELPSMLSKSLPNRLEGPGKPVNASSRRITELDAVIGKAQTVHDLSQILEPILQGSISSAALSDKVLGGIEISSLSIIQEFRKDDVVQEFQRQIHNLEQENEDLKSSMSKHKHSDLFERLEALQL